MDIKSLIGKKLLILDESIDNKLNCYEKGLLDFSQDSLIQKIYKKSFEDGANIVYANTGSINHINAKKLGYCMKEHIQKAVNNSQIARLQSGFRDDKFIAFHLKSQQISIKDYNDFDKTSFMFKEIARLAIKSGVDIIAIDIKDVYELKSAIIAVKELSDIPIIACINIEDDCKDLQNSYIQTAIAVMETLKVDVIDLKFKSLKNNMLIKDILNLSSTPIALNLDIKYLDYIDDFVENGVSIIKNGFDTSKVYEIVKKYKVKPVRTKNYTIISSNEKSLICDRPILIGERINPTGKKLMQSYLEKKDFSYIIKEALLQEKNGAKILDINVNHSKIDEEDFMVKLIFEIQKLSSIVLQIDSININTVKKALRYYNGKPILNSVNASENSMQNIFPLIKKYGGAIIGLTLDEDGLPKTAKKRYELAKKIVDTAKKYNIDKKDIIIDPLCLPIKIDKNANKETVKSLKIIKQDLGVKTVLGISNISYGMTQRDEINSNFLQMTLENGLDFAIVNPMSDKIKTVYKSHTNLILNNV